ncbi:MAG: ATP synthase subunit I [candidate division Zixibacteria bacterium]|nr:ATP synthase subunit I [candidate division Zixibacteria bacterium]
MKIEKNPTDQDPEAPTPGSPVGSFLSKVYKWSLLCTLTGLVVLIGLGYLDAGANFGIGAMVGLFMMYSTGHLVQRYLIPADQPFKNRRRLMALMMAKLPILVGVLYLVTTADWFHPAGFILGLSILPVMLTISGMGWLFFSETGRPAVRRTRWSGGPGR